MEQGRGNVSNTFAIHETHRGGLKGAINKGEIGFPCQGQGWYGGSWGRGKGSVVGLLQVSMTFSFTSTQVANR